LPAQHLVETFKLFGFPAHYDSFARDSKTYQLSSLLPHPLITLPLPDINPPILAIASTPHHTSISLDSIFNMRSFAIFGVAALVASVAGQTGTINSLPHLKKKAYH
jgi:hypothetical protein